MDQTIWKRRDCVSAEVDGALVLLDLETLVYHSLNKTAAAVWDLLETPQGVPTLVASLCERYRVTPEHCTGSLERLFEVLKNSNLVMPAEAA